jgi:ribonucleoside-diphosphate reductase alpha chain
VARVEESHAGELTPSADAQRAAAAPQQALPSVSPGFKPFSTIQNQEDAPPCSTCGAIMIRSGACYKCVNCGNTSGCA